MTPEQIKAMVDEIVRKTRLCGQVFLGDDLEYINGSDLVEKIVKKHVSAA